MNNNNDNKNNWIKKYETYFVNHTEDEVKTMAIPIKIDNRNSLLL